MKKAQGFSQIQIFLLAMFVLIVLVLIFGGHFRSAAEDTKSCAARGGKCISKETDCVGSEAFGDFSDCDNEKEDCCVMYR